MAASKYTRSAQEALQSAQQLMHARQHTQLDVEHIFLALLQQPNSPTTQVIAYLNVNVFLIIHKLEEALNDIPRGQGVSIGSSTPRVERVLQSAAAEAQHLNSDLIGTEHLLLAIADEQAGPSARILHQAGIDRGKIFITLRMIPKEQSQVPEVPIAKPDEESKIQNPKSKIINPPSLPQPRGFNHGILVTGGCLLFLSGQTALDAEGHIVAPGDVVAQYTQVLDNLKAVVEEAGGKMQDIVKINIFVRDRNDYVAHLKELGQVHKSFFGAYYPATALFEVSRFFDEEALVEIEGIAVLE